MAFYGLFVGEEDFDRVYHVHEELRDRYVLREVKERTPGLSFMGLGPLELIVEPGHPFYEYLREEGYAAVTVIG